MESCRYRVWYPKVEEERDGMDIVAYSACDAVRQWGWTVDLQSIPDQEVVYVRDEGGQIHVYWVTGEEGGLP